MLCDGEPRMKLYLERVRFVTDHFDVTAHAWWLTSSTGQFECGSTRCNNIENLKSWEVNFGYIENGEKKNELVKLRLCPSCSDKLNYKTQKRAAKAYRSSKNEKRRRSSGDEEDGASKKRRQSISEDDLEKESKCR